MKRLFDLIISLVGLITFSPIIIALSIGLFFANKGNPFYFQKRPGKNEILFSIIKFKTMNDKRNNDGSFKSDSERLTSIGRLVRKTSLDEIPQLINVLKGDMSLVGPRPLLTEYLPLYNKAQKKRHNIRPGITGWAQVNGRNAISWGKKFKLDVWYVENQSILLDLKILILTVKKVLMSDGISQKNQATAKPFSGNN
jgi:lipopolysaccharide/colanic/teichoic acid biosynthesis glycosyltransferase